LYIVTWNYTCMFLVSCRITLKHFHLMNNSSIHLVPASLWWVGNHSWTSSYTHHTSSPVGLRPRSTYWNTLPIGPVFRTPCGPRDIPLASGSWRRLSRRTRTIPVPGTHRLTSKYLSPSLLLFQYTGSWQFFTWPSPISHL